MNILVTNCGSLSSKYQPIGSTSEAVPAKGLCERIGIEGSQITYWPAGGEKGIAVPPMPTHTQAIQTVLDALTNGKTGVIKSLDEVETVGYRIVHGEKAFTASALITEDAIKAVEECSDSVPPYNSTDLTGARICQELMSNTPMVGVFDAALHQTTPEKVYLYGLPYEYYKKYKVRRYGLHGTSHSYASKRMAETLGRPYDSLKTVVCHLGNSSNISAIFSGKSVNTGMGLIPLEGLVMGTRGGDVDPDALQFIMHKENMDVDQMLNVLNKKSGIYGISGVSGGFRDVENAANGGNKKAEAVLESSVYRVAKYVGTHAAAMSGVDVIAFTAGVDENDKTTRKKVCGYLAFLGVEIGDEANSKEE